LKFTDVNVLGTAVPVETVEDLLDLLCFYNSADLPETQFAEELHFQLVTSEKKRTIKNAWKWALCLVFLVNEKRH